MCVLSKGHRMAGIQGIPIGVKPLVGKSDSIKKSPKPENYFQNKAILWLDKPIHEICPEFIKVKFYVTPIISKKRISLIFVCKRVNLNQEEKNTITEFLSSVKTSKISIRAESQVITLKFDTTSNITPERHKTLLAKYKGEVKLPNNPLEFTEHCSNNLNKIMTDEDKILKDVKKAVEDGRPLERFGAYLITFQRDINVKEGRLFNENKLKVLAALKSPLNSLLHETHPGQFGMKSIEENI